MHAQERVICRTGSLTGRHATRVRPLFWSGSAWPSSGMTADRSSLPINSNVHTLLCIKSDAADRLVDEPGRPRGANESRRPNWVNESLRRAPWAVVRRVAHDSLIPVGIRGESRG